MHIGIAFDLKSDFVAAAAGNDPSVADAPDAPDDRLEEYDSTATVEGIAGALRTLGHEAVLLGGGRRLVETLLSNPPELVFNIAEGFGTRSREAHVPGVCEMLKVPFTHSDPLTLAVTLDKAMAKRLVASFGVATPRFAVVTSARQAEDLPLAFPLIAKPLFEGSSMGIRRSSRVTDVTSLRRECERILGGYSEPVLVEEFCTGPEFTVGILGTAERARVLGVMEIVPKRVSHAEFVYSIEVKRDWVDEVEYHVPPKRDRATVRAIEDLALAAYRALGCRDIGRVDVRLDAAGEPKFLEVNPLPGLNPVTGDLPILATLAGMPYVELVGSVVRSACERQGLAR